MKRILLFAIMGFILAGCGTWKNQYGEPLSQADEFKCKQACGYYERNFNPFMGGVCLSDCYTASGYSIRRSQSKENEDAIRESARQSEEFDRLGAEEYKKKYNIK